MTEVAFFAEFFLCCWNIKFIKWILIILYKNFDESFILLSKLISAAMIKELI